MHEKILIAICRNLNNTKKLFFQDDTIPYFRGGYPYKRPIGAHRWGLKVRGRYSPDDKWLGSSGGHRTKSDEGEWAVAYHGTREINATQILQEGFKLECCVRAA